MYISKILLSGASKKLWRQLFVDEEIFSQWSNALVKISSFTYYSEVKCFPEVDWRFQTNFRSCLLSLWTSPYIRREVKKQTTQRILLSCKREAKLITNKFLIILHFSSFPGRSSFSSLENFFCRCWGILRICFTDPYQAHWYTWQQRTLLLCEGTFVFMRDMFTWTCSRGHFV